MMAFDDNRRQELASAAFNGQLEALYDHCLAVMGYAWAGVVHDANGLSKAECIEAVRQMGDDEIEECLAIDGWDR